MSTNVSTVCPPADVDDPDLRAADAAAVMEQLVSGRPLDRAVAARVRARAERVTEDLRRARGVVDDATFQSLLDDDA